MIDFLGVMEMRECCCKYFLLFLVKKMSFCLEFEKKDILLHPSSRPGGGIGRRAGLKSKRSITVPVRVGTAA